jgi:hypothetical protein
MSVSSGEELDLAIAPVFRKAKWTITTAASFGWFFDSCVSTIYAVAIPLIAQEFDVSCGTAARGRYGLFG